MQTNFNSTQNFGMAMKIKPEAKALLTKRLRKESDIEILSELIQKQKYNPYDIDLRSGNNDRFEVFITNTNDKTSRVIENMHESWGEKVLFGPLSFIKKVCRMADSLNEKNYNPALKSKINDVLKNVPEH